MKQQFVERTELREKTRQQIDIANAIIEEYVMQGYRLTLRQLYYQHVARGLVENTERSYKNMSELISKGRLMGLIDWDMIEDRTRSLHNQPHWESPQEIMESAYQSYGRDKWETQSNRVEVWIEKDALVTVISRVCREWDVPFLACRGYMSQSEMYVSSQRLREYKRRKQRVTILHLGDHDPSGLDMTRDNSERLSVMLEQIVNVKRIALNMNQVEEYALPPNPTKPTDSRATNYKYDSSWELDALEPSVIERLIETEVVKLIDRNEWKQVVKLEKEERMTLQKIARNFNHVKQ